MASTAAKKTAPQPQPKPAPKSEPKAEVIDTPKALVPTSNQTIITRYKDQIEALGGDGVANELKLAVNAAQLTILTQKTNPRYIRTREGRGGKQMKYVDHAYVTERLNLAFGWAWDFSIIESGIFKGFDDKPFEAWCRGRLSVTTSSGVITKEQFGCQPIELLKSGTNPVSLGDALKGAGSDCLKKCASLLGLALDLYDSDGDIAGDRNQAATPKAPTTAAAAPTETGPAVPQSVPSQPAATEPQAATPPAQKSANPDDGILKYQMKNNVRQVWLETKGKGNWISAELPLPKFLKVEQISKLTQAILTETFGKNSFELVGHLKRHFHGKQTVASLTGEELAGLLLWKEQGKADPRWYADKISEQAQAGVEVDETEVDDSYTQDLAERSELATAYGVAGDDDVSTKFLANLAQLDQPLKLKALFYPKMTWATHPDELANTAALLVEKQLEWADVEAMAEHA